MTEDKTVTTVDETKDVETAATNEIKEPEKKESSAVSIGIRQVIPK